MTLEGARNAAQMVLGEIAEHGIPLATLEAAHEPDQRGHRYVVAHQPDQPKPSHHCKRQAGHDDRRFRSFAVVHQRAADVAKRQRTVD